MTGDRWAGASRGLTQLVDRLSVRNDLLVSVSDGHVAPGTFFGPDAEITIDASVVLPGVNPDVYDFADPIVLVLFPVLAGVLAHEVAHAEHSTARSHPDPVVAEWASMLEEPRIERAAIAERPHVRAWLRSAVTTLINPCVRDAASAAEVLVLIGGRIAAGVVSSDEIDVDGACRRWLTSEQFFVVSDAVCTAVELPDGDDAGLFAQAERIARVLGGDPPSRPVHAGDGADGGGRDELGHRLAEIARDGAGAMALPQELAGIQVRAVRAGAGSAKHRVLRRRPSADELRAERRLLLRMRRAEDRGVDVREVPSRMPTGRVVTSELVQRSAQRAVGLSPTAAAWRDRTRRVRPRPRLAVGIAADISGSQSEVMEAVGVATWLLERTARDRGGRSATVIWDDRVSVLEAANGASVPIPQAAGGSSGLPEALRTLDAKLSLTTDMRAPRLVAVVTDGYLWQEDTINAEIRRLLAAGVRVLWLDTGAGDGIVPPSGTTVTRLASGTDPAAVIADGAVAALADPGGRGQR